MISGWFGVQPATTPEIVPTIPAAKTQAIEARVRSELQANKTGAKLNATTTAAITPTPLEATPSKTAQPIAPVELQQQSSSITAFADPAEYGTDTPTILGEATDTSVIFLKILTGNVGGGKTIYDSGAVAVDRGRWWHKVEKRLPNGYYFVNVYGPDRTTLLSQAGISIGILAPTIVITSIKVGEKWKIGERRDIYYEPNSIYPTPYLGKMENGEFVPLGVMTTGQTEGGIIKWTGTVGPMVESDDRVSWLPDPGQYYIRLWHYKSGVSDVSDYSIELVP